MASPLARPAPAGAPSTATAREAGLVPPPAGARRRALRRWTPYLYLLPMVLLVGVFLIYPAVKTVWVAFTDATGTSAGSFVGLDNFTRLVEDPAFRTSVRNTIYWVIGALVLQVGLGLLLALILSNMRAGDWLKRLFYLPATLSGAAVGVIWFYVFNPDQGLLTSFMGTIGLESLTTRWLADPPVNTFAMIFAATWQGLGPAMILFLVGLQNLPREPIEAARVDGARGLRLFWHVTLPLLRPMSAVVVAITLINNFKVFDLIWVMTQGGPYRSSETLAVSMYRESFVTFSVGYGASIAVVLTLIVTILSVFYLRSMFRKVEVY
ncbi:carbohydrate ABC transporter permease [Conexibacter arvalis]|uniref:Multiple sugar transport system permease protein n=1 Tax=Conexibacter arvalis TaxID=912552 RepID=A0A840IF40_9ACTN|nr:sugar ABC transporter permease [Conexibacter arvalis]MBB4662841.1 multiple sugar transport system permease protein [Conexibacter arvalis]